VAYRDDHISRPYAGDEKREKLIKRIALAVVVILVAGTTLYRVCRNYRETHQAKLFLALLQKQRPQPIFRHGRSALVEGLRSTAPIFLGEHSTVERSARVGPNVVLGDNCQVGSGARVTNSILFDEVAVGKGAMVSGAIIASNVSIGNRVKIEPGTVISPNVQISDGVKIRRNAMVHPYKEITTNVATGMQIM
jgi:ADP-glucose pyrophosphorylase